MICHIDHSREFLTRRASRTGYSLLLVIFVLTLVGTTLLTLGNHFRFTARHAQSAQMEAQAAQILHSGLDWSRVHPPQASPAADQPPILLDATDLAGPGGKARLTCTWDPERETWRLTAHLERGRRRITQSVDLPRQTSESNRPDSR